MKRVVNELFQLDIKDDANDEQRDELSEELDGQFFDSSEDLEVLMWKYWKTAE